MFGNRSSRTRSFKLALSAVVALVLGGAVLLAAFPVGLLRGTLERKLSAEIGGTVKIGALERDEFISFAPLITLRDVRIRQPKWAGSGDMMKMRRASARMPVLALLKGNFDPRSLDIDGLDLALVRDAHGRSNWSGNDREKSSKQSPRLRLDSLTITDARFLLTDAKRRLDVSGTISASPQKGLSVDAKGRFNGSPATLQARGGGPAQGNRSWPFSASLSSKLLELAAQGRMTAPLDVTNSRMKITARGNSLKQLDYIIEAGLFGSQAINLTGDVRRAGADWYIDRLDGTIGRSRIRAKATVRKREGRTKIDAAIDAAQLDFDDLADDAGLAAARAKEARIGPRIIPDTRINLSKMGPTDGVIHLVIRRLLVKGGSVFRSVSGTLTLDHRVLRLDDAVAGLGRGKMAGWVKVDSTGAIPILSTELHVEGATLDDFIGQPDMIRGPVRGLIRVAGPGDTIREAFANGSGKIAFVATGGAINRAAAYVIGQDLGGAIGQKLGGDDKEMTPIRCAIFSFTARHGLLSPSPLVIDTAISGARGNGQINLDGEIVALAMNGAVSEKAELKLVDPLRVTGTLSKPAISFAPAGKKDKGDGILGAVGRSIGNALGLRKDSGGKRNVSNPGSVDCRALSGKALR